MNKLIPAFVISTIAAVGILTFTNRSSGPLTGTIQKTQSAGACDSQFVCWVCKKEVKLDFVEIIVDQNNTKTDAIKFGPGCKGVIAKLVVLQRSGDGIKVTQGAENIVVNSGQISCEDKSPDVHQDAIQAMGGSNIDFRHMVLDCGRSGIPLIDSNFFVNESGTSTEPPQGIVCENCWLGPDTAHTVNIQDSSGSGLKNSVICYGKYKKLTFTQGPGAKDVVNEGNQVQSC